MANILQRYTDDEVVTISDLADAARSIHEFANTGNHLNMDVDVEVTDPTASSGRLDIYIAGANTSGNFTSVTDVLTVWSLIDSIDLSATKKKINFRIEGLKRHNAIMVNNLSGEALTTTTLNLVYADLTND